MVKTHQPGRTSKSKRERSAGVAMPAGMKPFVAALSRETGVAVEKGWGSGNIVLKVRGKIFVMLMGDELVFKLPKSRVDEFVQRREGRRFDPRRDGREMKEWLVVPSGPARRVSLAREAYRFVSGQ